MPGERFVPTEFVTYECGCEAEVNEYQPNRFNIFLRNCGNNYKVIPKKNLTKAKVKFELLNSNDKISEHLDYYTYISECDEFIDGEYFVFEKYYINFSKEEFDLNGVDKALVIFTTLKKAEEYSKNVKIIHPRKFDYLTPKKMTKKQIIVSYKYYHTHCFINLESNCDLAYIITNKTKIVKLV